MSGEERKRDDRMIIRKQNRNDRNKEPYLNRNLDSFQIFRNWVGGGGGGGKGGLGRVRVLV